MIIILKALRTTAMSTPSRRLVPGLQRARRASLPRDDIDPGTTVQGQHQALRALRYIPRCLDTDEQEAHPPMHDRLLERAITRHAPPHCAGTTTRHFHIKSSGTSANALPLILILSRLKHRAPRGERRHPTRVAVGSGLRR